MNKKASYTSFLPRCKYNILHSIFQQQKILNTKTESCSKTPQIWNAVLWMKIRPSSEICILQEMGKKLSAISQKLCKHQRSFFGQ